MSPETVPDSRLTRVPVEEKPEPVKLWQCRVCRGARRPKEDWCSYRGLIVCGRCLVMGFVDTLERVQ